MADRNRALSIRNRTVAAAGKPSAISRAEKARKVLNQLLRVLPVKQFIMIPRNHKEAHHRPDSMCRLLRLPFKVLGPLLFSAAILVRNKRGGGLGFSQHGFTTLVNLYNRQPSYDLRLVKKSLSAEAIKDDAHQSASSTRVFFYIYRGQIVPAYYYKPSVLEDLIVTQNEKEFAVKAAELSEEILGSLSPALISLFEAEGAVTVDTTTGPSSPQKLITPTEGERTPFSPPQRSFSGRVFHSPPIRTPGKSPPFQRLRRGDGAHPFGLEEVVENEQQHLEEECHVVTVEDDVDEDEKEEEKKDDDEEEISAQPTVEDEIEASRRLDFNARNADGRRPPRNPASKSIFVGNRKQATESMRIKITWLADQWGYSTKQLKKDKLPIAEAASRVVFYDCGYPSPPKGHTVAAWAKALEQARYNIGTDFSSALSNDQLGSKQGSYCEQIEAAFPGYLHEMYRKAGNDPHVTFRATFSEMADAMNDKSKRDSQGRPELDMTRTKLKVWFNAWKGKVRKGWERPILTPERMEARVEWCKERKAELSAADASASFDKRYYCFLDEKWFYIRSRRKKLKVLPLGPHESEGAADIPIERESSRRHATKVMYLGVIARPEEAFGFDGKVFLQRVARTKTLRKATYSDKILDDLAANSALQRQWHGYVSANQTAQQMIDFVADTVFDMEEETKKRLIIRYKDHSETGTPTWKKFSSLNGKDIKPKPDLPRRPLEIQDLVMQAFYKKGDEVPEDVTCDSEFMMAHMDSIGRAIRAKYHWVPAEQAIFLVMDNAGGHGTRDAILLYVQQLKDDHNVIVIWQEPRGPELNLLDLGAWVSLQSAVEKHFRGNRNNAEVLARKIEEVWSTYDASVFHKIWDRWRLALDLIIADKGNNRLVNEYRKKLFTPAAPDPAPDGGTATAPANDYDANEDDDDADSI